MGIVIVTNPFRLAKKPGAKARDINIRGREFYLDGLVERKNECILCWVEGRPVSGSRQYFGESGDLRGQVRDVIDVPDGLSSSLKHGW